MRFPRASGILLHLTSLPSKHGIGDMGPDAYQFVDWLKESKQTLWQVLPLGVANHLGCPYSAHSAFGGYPLLISPDLLIKEGLLQEEDIEPREWSDQVDYDEVTRFKLDLFRKAFDRFKSNKNNSLALANFIEAESEWVKDLTLFLVISASEKKPWYQWSSGLKKREPEVITAFIHENQDEIAFYQFLQYIFDKQWMALKKYANSAKIEIIGDSPMFVAHHSMDVWRYPKLFKLDRTGEKLVQTGSNPDEFSKKGQIWGSPNYDWEEMSKDGYAWWIRRMEKMFTQFDRVRLDYFKGFEATWEIPLNAKDGREGNWTKGPGLAFFKLLQKHFKRLPIIVEDLGDIRPEVYDLRDEFDFTGMKVLQFAFGTDKANNNLPYLYNHNCAVYTATHDNDTSIGYFHQSTNQIERDFFCEYASIENLNNINWDLIKIAMESCADIAIIPLQDILGLGSESRFNIPGTKDGNWNWRFSWLQLSEFSQEQLIELTQMTGRIKK